MFNSILAAIAPVLATTGLAFAWVRAGRTLDSAAFTPLLVDIGTPFLIFATFAKTSIAPQSFASMALASLAALACFALVGILSLSVLGLSKRAFLPALTFPNSGNLGLPLALYAFGQDGLGYAIVFHAISMTGQFTAGPAIAGGGASWRGILRMPIIYAVILGGGVAVWGVRLPVWLANTVTLIGGMTIPIMLLMLGASLARLKVRTVSCAAMVSALRIILGSAIGLAAAALLGVEDDARRVLILQCAMPSGVTNYLFAQRWNNHPEEVASVIVVSTLASVVSVPMLLHFLMR